MGLSGRAKLVRLIRGEDERQLGAHGRRTNTIRVTLLSFSTTETLERKQPIALFQPNRVHLTRIATEREQSLNTNLMLRPLLRFRDEIFDTFSPVKSSPTSKKTQKGSRAYNSSSSLKLKKKVNGSRPKDMRDEGES